MMREGGGKQRLITFSAATVSASARAQIKSEFDLFIVFLLFELRKTTTHRCFQIARQMNECVYHAVTQQPLFQPFGNIQSCAPQQLQPLLALHHVAKSQGPKEEVQEQPRWQARQAMATWHPSSLCKVHWKLVYIPMVAQGL
jgi:hypothetical protein